MAIVIDPSESRDRRIKMLLETAQVAGTLKNQRDELELKRQEQDPRVQAGKMANMLFMMGNTEAATKMFEFAKTGTMPPGGVQLPSQQAGSIPNYMGGQTSMTGQVTPQPAPGVVLPSASPIVSGMVGSVNSKGVANMKIGGQAALDPMTDANLDIHKTLTTEGLKKEQENRLGAEKTLSGTDRYLQQFERSYNELKRFDPEIDKIGLQGKVSRLGGKVANSLDQLPETQALQAMAKPLAQQIATDIEGRATDEDRKIQTEAFADVLKKPSASNIRVASNSLLMLKDKGADISKVVRKLAQSDTDVMKSIVEQVYESAPELRPKKADVDSLFEGL